MTAALAELFEKYGTDKVRSGYHDTYEELFGPKRFDIRSVLEVGIGTLVPGAASSMVGYAADHYRPGGSLRAWRDWFPNAQVWGIDPQPDTQFQDDRIVTRLADSTNVGQTDAALGDATFDIIIDDGDHQPASQRATFSNLFRRLRPGGFYVIEDVGASFPDVSLIILRAKC